MTPGLMRVALQMAVWIVVVAAVLLLLLDPHGPEFVITVVSLSLGLLFIGLVWFVGRRLFR